MPTTLKGLVKLLMGSREGELPILQAFPPLDIEQIASELGLDERAKENGRSNFPDPDSQVDDIVEYEIVAEIERRARKAFEDYQAQIDLYDGRIRRVLFSPDKRAEIVRVGESVMADFRVQAINDRNQLENARREVEGTEREFKAFRLANKLERLPKIISNREKIGRFLIIAILIVIESIVNGLFFAKGSETGLIGGFAQALVLSILNVGVAVLYACYGIPLITNAKRALKLGGGLSTGIYILWTLIMNLSVGHFRDLFVQNTGQVTADELLLRIMETPFHFNEAHSLILVVLGIFLNICSLIDAAGLDDHYLGYGNIGRRRATAVSDYANQKAWCLKELTRRRDEAMDDLEQIIKLIRSEEFELRLAIEGRSRLHEHLRAFLKHLAICHTRLLLRYYEANINMRTAPPPSRFRNRPTSPDFLDEPSLREVQELGSDDRMLVIRRLERFIRAINQRFELEVRHYRTVIDLTD